MTFEIVSIKPEDTSRIGSFVAKALSGGEVIELVGDLGAGKTELVRGLVSSLDEQAVVQSPSFTISREYETDRLKIYHYDFYRLGNEPGIVAEEIAEALGDDTGVVITEWADEGALPLPKDRLVVRIQSEGENRRLRFEAGGAKSQTIISQIEKEWK